MSEPTDTGGEAIMRERDALQAENARLREALSHAETATATPDGLTPDGTIAVHQFIHAALEAK